MKLLKNLLATFFVLMVALITFYTYNLICSAISNYQSLSPVALSSLPLVFFVVNIYVILFALYNYIVLKRRDAYFYKKYSLIVGIISIFGIAFSIVTGTFVYHSFVKDYIFLAYPLFMLLMHVFLLGISCYLAFVSIRDIIKEKPEKTWKNTKFYWVRETLMGLMLVFALERLGGFVLLPIYYSSYDGIYVLPMYFQLLVPVFLFIAYMVDRQWLHNKKVNIILFSIAFAYSALSLGYMLIMANAFKMSYQTLINPLSPVMQLERLVTKPYGFMILYGFSLIYSGVMLTLNIIGKIKEKKA